MPTKGPKPENLVFQLGMLRMQLKRLKKSAEKDARTEERNATKEMKKHDFQMAEIHVANATRKLQEKKQWTVLLSNVEATKSQVEMFTKVNDITYTMNMVSSSMKSAQKYMNPEKMTNTMSTFEDQMSDLGATVSSYQDAVGSSTAVSVPQEEVDRKMRQLADEAQIDLQERMDGAKAPEEQATKPMDVLEEELGSKLAALRAS